MGLFNWLFRRMTDRVFTAVDRNKSGSIEDIEIEIAIYRIYNIINKRLPGWQDPPKRAEIMAALVTFDVDRSGALDKAEFNQFARNMLNTGPDQFFSRVGKDAAMKTAVIPFATKGIQSFAKGLGFQPVADAPLHLAAPVVDVAFRAVRALLPIGI